MLHTFTRQKRLAVISVILDMNRAGLDGELLIQTCLTQVEHKHVHSSCDAPRRLIAERNAWTRRQTGEIAWQQFSFYC